MGRYRTRKRKNLGGLCVYCGTYPVTPNTGGRFQKYCPSCHTVYRRFKKDHCEICGFVAVHRCQLDVDHIDGDCKNNDISNLRTLCANCHRLKTQMKKQNRPHKFREEEKEIKDDPSDQKQLFVEITGNTDSVS
jgi:hypothetical protein